MDEKKRPRIDSGDRPKYNKTNIKCPYCDHSASQKIRFALDAAVPNLVECESCAYHFIVIQKTVITHSIVEIQDQIETSARSGIQQQARTIEGGSREL